MKARPSLDADFYLGTSHHASPGGENVLLILAKQVFFAAASIRFPHHV